MAKQNKRATLPGSERKPLLGAKPKGATDPNEQIEVTVRIRSKKAELKTADLMAQGGQMPANRKYLSREAFADAHGADPADVAKIGAFAHDHGLTLTGSNLSQRTVKLSGTVANFNVAFGVKLRTFKSRGVTYRGRTGAISIPNELKDMSESAATIKLFFRSMVAPDCSCEYTTSGRSGG